MNRGRARPLGLEMSRETPKSGSRAAHARRMTCVLVVAGVDPGGGAGIAADVRAIAAGGAFACPVVATLTVQSTAGLVSQHPVEAKLVTAQAEEVLAHQRVRVIKTGALGSERKKQVRQSSIAFNQLRAPFSVGKGQFQLSDAYVNGPVLGATMRGRVDFKTQTVNLGGTYVPLYGLNSALGAIPILGGIFVGREGEGVVGITFAIQGKLDDPNVLVNPVSVVAPGIFRQIFEFRGEGQNAASSTAQPPNDFLAGPR